ncbi:MAG TPA: 2-amino-4-hydroxy-6-hydroxymethyldihydropteridine diphosphokinase [Firmicutes bacterium]|nr:2-amino-4-hydroxy-6-hydroxymethyldihydropteridine diphosphokinase [Bacillota bacterium]HBK68224.1 2-amino-4-hydroxy-6-hydroxymethyldihydropteridine diphosphokinase [Bacillota bacterium]HBT16466.1 2-amino-4-hydroxy-6-hydroxymethyldihydropteridine diphosphokinase [Bacillota bacterium]
MYTLAIALGANQGNREQNLKEAGKKLSFFIEDLVFSSVYETEPVGYQQQPWFLNQVCLGKTSHFPLELLFELKAIEKELGRVPGPRFGPRLLDLDILFYDRWVLDSALLTIPHPRLWERSFVLQPLLEIAPDWIDPREGRSLRQVWEGNKHCFSQCNLFLPRS